MSAYRAVVVGTDGSASSLRAVRHAGALAGACRARLLIVCAYLPQRAVERPVRRVHELLGEDATEVGGATPAQETVRRAAEEARAAGAEEVEEMAVVGSPVETLLDVVDRAGADLLVVGNRGLDSLRGRLMGSVPADVTRRAGVDVLVVHTTD